MFKVDSNFSQKCMDNSIDSGRYDPFGESETMYIENGQVQAENETYGIDFED